MTLAPIDTSGSPGIDRFSSAQLLRTARACSQLTQNCPAW